MKSLMPVAGGRKEPGHSQRAVQVSLHADGVGWDAGVLEAADEAFTVVSEQVVFGDGDQCRRKL